MDFKGMLEDIIGFLPSSRQILLYSATFPRSVKEFKVSCNITVKPDQAHRFWIYYLKVECVGSWRFQIHLCIHAFVMSSEFKREEGMKFYHLSVLESWWKCLQSYFVHSKIFSFWWNTVKLSLKNTAHDECRNVD